MMRWRFSAANAIASGQETFFHSPSPANHRLRNAIRRMGEGKGVATFYAEMTLADRRIERGLHLHDLIVARADHHLAADAAIGTGGARPVRRGPAIEDGFVFERAARTAINAGAAADT